MSVGQEGSRAVDDGADEADAGARAVEIGETATVDIDAGLVKVGCDETDSGQARTSQEASPLEIWKSVVHKRSADVSIRLYCNVCATGSIRLRIGIYIEASIGIWPCNRASQPL